MSAFRAMAETKLSTSKWSNFSRLVWEAYIKHAETSELRHANAKWSIFSRLMWEAYRQHAHAHAHVHVMCMCMCMHMCMHMCMCMCMLYVGFPHETRKNRPLRVRVAKF